MGLSEFMYIMAAICFRWQCSVTSWIRSHKHNKDVGGMDDSLHLWGLAVDIVPDDWDNLQWILADIKEAGLHYLVEDDHIHVQIRAKRRKRR